MSDVERLRLFVAVSVPEDRLRVVDEAIGPLKEKVTGARWAPLDNQHVTVKFLGSTPAVLIPDVRTVLETTARAHVSSEVRIDELGVFPTLRRARVLWAGLDDPAGLLQSVARALSAGFEPLGYVPEKRAFTPHLTLARFKSPPRLEGTLPALPAAKLAPFSIQALELYRSRLSPKGARYELLESFRLGEVAA
jgi:RNA 2',3'-cyclic 3'-phosphodiesterase